VSGALLVAIIASVWHRNAGLRIHNAEYGIGHGNYKDVTEIVQKAVRDDVIDISVDNDSLGGDPFPHSPKHLKVKYSFGPREARKNERDRLVLPIGPTPEVLPIRRVRLLEYHAMHLGWLRDMMLDSTSTTELVNDVERAIEKHRAMLQDLSPSVFPPSVTARFAVPGMLSVASAKSRVGALPDGDTRAFAIAKAESLLDIVKSAWREHDGVRAPRP
jgi:hypothetical protein